MAQVDTSDLIRKVRAIEIKTRGLSRQVFAGEYHSAFKGRGVTFSEVREYQYGDDIRTIDWNVTARFSHPFVKVYEEERELTVMLLVDVSKSGEFGSSASLKRNLITEVSAVLSFSAISNNDKIGVIFFSDQVEKYIPPKKGRKHILHIIRELIEFQPKSRMTDLHEALRFLTNVIKKRCTAFILSDFFCPPPDDALRIAARKHDLVALQVFDERETRLPSIGLVKFRDPESGLEKWVDTSYATVRTEYRKAWENHNDILRKTLARNGVDHTLLQTDKDYIKPLIELFKRR
jgi:uncharacterized protein (DUF58 family)